MSLKKSLPWSIAGISGETKPESKQNLPPLPSASPFTDANRVLIVLHLYSMDLNRQINFDVATKKAFNQDTLSQGKLKLAKSPV